MLFTFFTYFAFFLVHFNGHFIFALMKLLSKVNNTGYNVKLRAKKLDNGLYSLFLDYRIQVDYKTFRERKFLKLYLTGKPQDLTSDKSKISEAIILRVKYNDISRKKIQGIFSSTGSETLYFITETIIKNQHNKRTASGLKTFFNTLKRFTKNKDSFVSEITQDFCQRFKKYCLDTYSNGSGNRFFGYLKQVLNYAVNNDLIDKSPARLISIPVYKSTRQFLTIDELKIVESAALYPEEAKRAFLFSCYTGLRYSDIVNIHFSDIKNDHLVIYQAKTKEPLTIKIHPKAVEIINEQRKNNSDHIFRALNLYSVIIIAREIRALPGINKHITFHSARHTFATLCITFGVDIYTVSKLLGHTDVKTTQIYAKLIDKKKDEAIDKLEF